MQCLQYKLSGGLAESSQEWFRYSFPSESNYIYLIGQKNGISEGSIFKNVGNDEDIKPFIIRMNSSFKIVNEFYINEKTKLEKIKNFAFNSNISFTIETFDKRFFHYELDNELKLIKHYELLPPIKYKDITKLNNNCYLLETLNTYYLGFKLSNSWHLIPLTDIDEIFDVLNEYKNNFN